MKFTSNYLFYIFCIVISLVSCYGIESKEAGSVVYFDLIQAVDEWIAEEGIGIRVKKTVSLNGESEKKTIDNYDLSQELSFLKKFDINKVALAGKYDVDTSISNGTQITTFTAKEEKLKTRLLKIWEQEEEVTKIEISAVQSSIMATIDQTITYEPSKLFHMTSTDTNKYSNDLMKEVLIIYESL